MMTKDGPCVLEYNVRFGDPECQPLLMRLDSDIAQVMLACAQGDLEPSMVSWSPRTALCVVMAAKGYPGPYPKGMAISGLGEGRSGRRGQGVRGRGVPGQRNANHLRRARARSHRPGRLPGPRPRPTPTPLWTRSFSKTPTSGRDIGAKGNQEGAAMTKVAIFIGSISDKDVMQPLFRRPYGTGHRASLHRDQRPPHPGPHREAHPGAGGRGMPGGSSARPAWPPTWPGPWPPAPRSPCSGCRLPLRPWAAWTPCSPPCRCRRASRWAPWALDKAGARNAAWLARADSGAWRQGTGRQDRKGPGRVCRWSGKSRQGAGGQVTASRSRAGV